MKDEKKQIALKFSVKELPEKIIFEEMNMHFKGHDIVIGKGKEFTWSNPKGGKMIQKFCQASFSTLESSYGLVVENDGSFKLFGR